MVELEISGEGEVFKCFRPLIAPVCFSGKLRKRHSWGARRLRTVGIFSLIFSHPPYGFSLLELILINVHDFAGETTCGPTKKTEICFLLRQAQYPLIIYWWACQHEAKRRKKYKKKGAILACRDKISILPLNWMFLQLHKPLNCHTILWLIAPSTIAWVENKKCAERGKWRMLARRNYFGKAYHATFSRLGNAWGLVNGRLIVIKCRTLRIRCHRWRLLLHVVHSKPCTKNAQKKAGLFG